MIMLDKNIAYHIYITMWLNVKVHDNMLHFVNHENNFIRKIALNFAIQIIFASQNL